MSRAASYQDDFSLQVGILASLGLHALFLGILLFGVRTHGVSPDLRIIDVSIEPPPQPVEPQRSQMVSPSEQTQALEKPPETTRQSDTDSTVLKEQIRRGSENAGPAVGPQTQPAPPASAKQQRTEEPPKPQKQRSQKAEKRESAEDLPSPKLGDLDLKLDSSTLMKEFGKSPPKPMLGQSSRPFSRPAGAGAMFVGMSGSSDYLPNLPDGDITLLNAKANQYAVFVRRVAIQVFSQIRALGWDSLSAADVKQIVRPTVIEAVMSPKGELLSVTLGTSSESSRFDDLIKEAARRGARDPNPPKGALADDGNVRFIFRSRSWSEIGSSRSGLPVERRWLLLETGLQ